MSRICIIPARGGSKRIPRKNIKLFLGKPIIAYSIEAALESGLFERVIVSTEDKEIGNIAEAYGAEVPFYRSEANANDFATTMDVLQEVHREVGGDFEVANCLYPTAPFVTTSLLREALALLLKTDVDAVFPVLKYGHPIQRAFSLNSDGLIRMREPDMLAVRTQDLLPYYHDCGMFYAYRPARVLPQNKIWTDNVAAIEVAENSAHDIDTLADWKIAELKYKSLR